METGSSLPEGLARRQVSVCLMVHRVGSVPTAEKCQDGCWLTCPQLLDLHPSDLVTWMVQVGLEPTPPSLPLFRLLCSQSLTLWGRVQTLFCCWLPQGTGWVLFSKEEAGESSFCFAILWDRLTTEDSRWVNFGHSKRKIHPLMYLSPGCGFWSHIKLH